MALETYDDLLAAIPKWVNKTSLDARAADFIALAEADFEPRLRAIDMQARVEGLVLAGCSDFARPGDWLEAIRLWIPGQKLPLSYATPDEMASLLDKSPDVPTRYSIGDGVIQLAPTPAADLTLRMSYWRRVPRLGPSVQTNWLTARNIGVYLYGALLQAAPYLIDDERLATWSGFYQTSIDQLNRSAQIALHSGGPLVRRVRGYGGGVNPVPWGNRA